MRHILYWLGLVDVVWLQWTPINYPLCIVWREPNGQPWLKYQRVWAKMLPDGRLEPQTPSNGWGNSERWHRYHEHPLKIAKAKKRMHLTWRRPTRVQDVTNKLTGVEHGI